MLKQYALPLVLLYVIILTVLSLVNISGVPSLGSSFDDKIYHSLAYFILTLLCYNYLRITRITHKILITACTTIVYGIIIEALQGKLSDSRISDFYDVIANIVGIIIGLIVLVYYLKTKVKMN